MVVIPNAVGDTLAAFGIFGIALRLVLQIVFFFQNQGAYSNYYRLALFLFIFIYQFTGSFITNIAEYVILRSWPFTPASSRNSTKSASTAGFVCRVPTFTD